MYYLATPYTHKDQSMVECRFQNANLVAAALMNAGLFVFSPISHSHPIAMAASLPTDWSFWEKYDRVMLACCSSVLVIDTPGWRESVGVTAEIAIAVELGLPVNMVDIFGNIGNRIA